MALQGRAREDWLQGLKIATSKKQITFRCEKCHHGPMKQTASPRSKAGLCESCWYELRMILKCKCPRIGGDSQSTYACALCPEYTDDDAKVKRMAILNLDRLDTEQDEANYERYHRKHGHSVRQRYGRPLQAVRQTVYAGTAQTGETTTERRADRTVD